MPQPMWEFSIDVGGTFTDFLARDPAGNVRRHKMLSTGHVKGAVNPGSHPSCIVDPARKSDPDKFWEGFELRLFDNMGQSLASAQVEHFDRSTGSLHLLTEDTKDRYLSMESAMERASGYELCHDYEAPILGIRYLMGLPLSEQIEPVSVRLGTTRSTNALLTRSGAPVALVTTKGFADLPLIGYQDRPRLFDLHIQKPSVLFTAVVEIDERVTHDGQILQAVDAQQIRDVLSPLRESGIQSLAICLLHGYAWRKHEQVVEAIARELGFEEISVSHKVAPLIKIVSRCDTTLMDAYLNPVLRGYVDRLRSSLPGSQLRLLTSAGGLVSADKFFGKDSILSGPAGGVVGFSRVAQAAGFSQAIGFDMGGTSTDVSRFDGHWDLEYETEKGGVRVVAPMMAIETIAAGGGSVCHFDGIKLAVGPDSAGADPGPACYGRGGPLAVTDMNFFLGKILPEHFPFPLNREVVANKLQAMCEEIEQKSNIQYTPAVLAEGFLQVAVANMTKAISSISTAKGCDPRDYVLVAFGGAAGQHACSVAGELGMRHVLSHGDSGILSAYGIGMADVSRHGVEGIYQLYTDVRNKLDEVFQRLERQTVGELREEGVDEKRITSRRFLDLRYHRLDNYLTIEQAEGENFLAAYEREHMRIYGYVHKGRPVEVVAARVEATGHSKNQPSSSHRVAGSPVQAREYSETYFRGIWHSTAIHWREDLSPGDRIPGPAIICETNCTIIVDPQWTAEILSAGEVLLSCSQEQALESMEVGTESDPVLLEIFNNKFAAIAQQMGITLQQTSSSVNVKERRDFSCALFTHSGDLVVNAPHIPVHLGAMSESVRAIVRDNPHMQQGDVFVTNDPYCGGSHLPDVTVITPVFEQQRGNRAVSQQNQVEQSEPENENCKPVFFTASRAHHAEIGGISPGSMPPFSKNLAEEGVLIRNFKLIDADQSYAESLRELLLQGPYPSRRVEDNLADIAAQVAANQRGANELMQLVSRYKLTVVSAYMQHIQDAAERKMRSVLKQLPDKTYTFEDHLDDGSPICVACTVSGDDVEIDFTGTGPVLSSNLNANRAIVTAAIMYVLRCLIQEDIPLNEGVLHPVKLILPECLLNPPRHADPQDCAAVVGGNVETSQRVVDVLLGAFAVAAASQGTMNNLLFGDKTFGYYETICGGSGATSDADGTDAVHTHMTNTRLTDPEVLELRFPVRVREFSIRRGSGGLGAKHGGSGVRRGLEFLQTLEVSLLTQRRGKYPPFGLQGGEPGAGGRNSLIRKGKPAEQLPGVIHLNVREGDQLWIETPGGGGFGPSQQDS